MHRGEIEKLKPEYRLALARDGCTRDVRARSVQAGGLRKKKGNTRCTGVALVNISANSPTPGG